MPRFHIMRWLATATSMLEFWAAVVKVTTLVSLVSTIWSMMRSVSACSCWMPRSSFFIPAKMSLEAS